MQSRYMAVCPPNGWCGHCTGLFAHPTGCVVTAHGCLSTKQVMWSLHRAVRPPGGMVTAHGCFSNERVMRSPHWTDCLPTKRVVWSQHEAVRPPNRWCGHQTGLFVHGMGGAVTMHGCLLTEWDCSLTKRVV